MALDPSGILLTERVVVVTGAANGIGRAIAVGAARFGAHVAICDRDADNLASAAAEIAATGRQVVPATIDVRDGDAVHGFFVEVQARLGRVDVPRQQRRRRIPRRRSSMSTRRGRTRWCARTSPASPIASAPRCR